jgi:hypothetical protein
MKLRFFLNVCCVATVFLLAVASSQVAAIDFREKRECTVSSPPRAPARTPCVISGGIQGGTIDISIKTVDGNMYALEGPIDGEEGHKFLLDHHSASKGSESTDWQCYRRNDAQLELCISKTGSGKADLKHKGFIFRAQDIRDATNPSQSVRLGEKISPQALKKRFAEYEVRYTKGEDCLTCAVVSGTDGQLQIDFAQDGRTIINVRSSDDRSRDAQGNSIGSSLLKALGSNSAQCDAGMDTTCASPTLRGLSYVVADDDRCPIAPKEKQPTDIPACARIAGFQIHGN